MTKDDDNDAEMRDLDLAMRTSLTEAEEQKNKEKPLEEYSAEELQQHFKGSLVLAAVSPYHSSLCFHSTPERMPSCQHQSMPANGNAFSRLYLCHFLLLFLCLPL